MKISIQIVPNEVGGFSATCPSLPGCAIRAESRELARKKLERAIEGYLSAVGEFVPERFSNQLVEV